MKTYSVRITNLTGQGILGRIPDKFYGISPEEIHAAIFGLIIVKMPGRITE